MRDNDPLSGLVSTVAGTIRAEAARRRISVRRLAQMTGLSKSYLGRRMTGAVSFDFNDIELIAKALDIPPAQIVADQPTERVA